MVPLSGHREWRCREHRVRVSLPVPVLLAFGGRPSSGAAGPGGSSGVGSGRGLPTHCLSQPPQQCAWSPSRTSVPTPVAGRRRDPTPLRWGHRVHWQQQQLLLFPPRPATEADYRDHCPVFSVPGACGSRGHSRPLTSAVHTGTGSPPGLTRPQLRSVSVCPSQVAPVGLSGRGLGTQLNLKP